MCLLRCHGRRVLIHVGLHIIIFAITLADSILVMAACHVVQTVVLGKLTFEFVCLTLGHVIGRYLDNHHTNMCK